MKQKTERKELEDITSTWEKAKLAFAPDTRNIRKKKLLVKGPDVKRRTK